MAVGFVGCSDDDGGPDCGDGVAQSNEVCDGIDLRGNMCADVGNFTGGTLACNGTCDGWDISLCTGCTAQCGDNVQAGSEVCDGIDLDGQTCTDFGYIQGTVACSAACDTFLLTGCNNIETATCGNNTLEALESCDGTDLAGATDCTDFGFTSGPLGCTADCRWDFSQCVGDFCALQNPSWYNDGYCDLCELLGGTPDPDCATVCNTSDGDCDSWLDPIVRVSTCLWSQGTEDPDCGTCGDGINNGATEYCDATDITAECTDLGYVGGILACDTNCNFDPSGCTLVAVCGNDMAEGAEVCDGTDLRNEDCSTIGMGFNQGTLACNGTCDDWNVTNCSFVCGAVDLGTFSGTPIIQTGDSCTGTTNYGNSTVSCTSYSASAEELLYSVVVPDGETITVTQTPIGGNTQDSSLYLLDDCADMDAVNCLAGADSTFGGEVETLNWTNTTGANMTVYIVVDAFSGCGQVQLDID